MGGHKIADSVRPQLDDGEVLTAAYGVYETKDGSVAFAAFVDSPWKALCELSGAKELLTDFRFGSVCDRARREWCQFITEWLGNWIEDRTTGEVMYQLGEVGIPFLGIPLKLSEMPGEIRSPPLEVNEHNEKSYCNLLELRSRHLSQSKQ